MTILRAIAIVYTQREANQEIDSRYAEAIDVLIRVAASTLLHQVWEDEEV